MSHRTFDVNGNHQVQVSHGVPRYKRISMNLIIAGVGVHLKPLRARSVVEFPYHSTFRG